ncbi:MAG: tripartite tricarboxylate transporter substrate binding protein [Reyranella sp.]|nr:tripartite tricarboxylate transporter substrate binding protein [Reyranella sp.]MDP3159692.1 tripartite tricarboxylate transporter substrate binding protein [Reyranella sp.]
MKRSDFLKGLGALALAPAISPAIVRAQSQFPDKQIRMVIPFAAGGTTDLLARALAQHMAQAWGQTVVADNRAGANGVVAGEIVAKAPGDGYTLSVVAMGHAINPLIYKKLPYDGVNDFTPISLIATFPQLVLVNPAVKANTLPELIQLARTASPPVTYASGGNGSSQHLAGALLAHMAKLDLTHVAYKGGNPAQLDLMAGNVQMMITQPNSKDLITTGKMRALAVSSAKRSQYYPELPTVAEAGVPGYESVAWYGLLGPKGMPADLVKKIADETVRACATEGAKSVVASQGGDMVAGTPAAFADFIVAERTRYATIVRESGMSVE